MIYKSVPFVRKCLLLQHDIVMEPQSGAVKFRLLTRAAVSAQASQTGGRIKGSAPLVELPTIDLPADVGFVARLVERKKVIIL